MRFPISHNAPYLLPAPPPQKNIYIYFIRFVFNFSWDGFNSKEK